MSTKASEQDRHFDRRQKAAKAGLHLPTEQELLHGMAFYRDDMIEDIREYASRLSRRVQRRRPEGFGFLSETLDELVVDPTCDAILSVEQALEHVIDTSDALIEECRLRCIIYRGLFGDARAAASVGGELALWAQRALPNARGIEFLCRAAAWSAYARNVENWQRDGIVPRTRNDRRRNSIDDYINKFTSSLRKLTERNEEPEQVSSKITKEKNDPFLPSGSASSADGIVVITDFGNDFTSEGKRTAREFDKIKGRPLPLPETPDLTIVRARLVAEFPYATSVVDTVLTGLVGRPHVHIRPTLLVGSPGSGKTRLARRLTEELGIPTELVSCGGLSDAAIGGNPRKWSTGEPSLPLMLIHKHDCAGPAIILDELEKVGSGRHNGHVHDALVGLLERETSCRWHDPYLEAACDLSNVSWLMTANSVGPIPTVLKDRCCVLQFPEPGAEHLLALAPRLLEAIYADAGKDLRWSVPLDAIEVDALASGWKGGSLRRLRRMLEMIVEARHREGFMH
ncbi:hypothetical protein GGQ99_002328 [Aminobacter niigataensis]|uniref:ATPase AAA-type core domain-containing protein n=1 Tax=Aminobacter niigataensis TaxID=83265 RepID=A0ABR6L1D4_9HYPH|nr:hypothetical protein [Aminobacter niigataensis]